MAALAEFATRARVDLTVVGPELPLTLGLVDELARRDLPVFGPTRAAAELEGSKVFAKNLFARYGVPTARFGTFDAATIAFGMRNLPDYRQGFAEMARSVRPGGRVVCLEIARPASGPLRAVSGGRR